MAEEGVAGPDTTVVVTCFNYGAFLGEAVESALSQDGPTPRVIVVDDGSTDAATVAVLDELPQGVEVVRQENQGLAAARTNGLRMADTQYLITLDADDRLAPGALAAMRAALERHPEAGFSYGWLQVFGDWDTTIKTPPYDPYKLLYRHMIGVSGLMRREVFADVGAYEADYPGYEDWQFWLHALEYGWRGVNVERVTLEYRRHGRTMLHGSRLAYRSTYKRLRARHAGLYARSAEFARESDAGALERAIYKYVWGPRPYPPRLEQMLYHLLFRSRGG